MKIYDLSYWQMMRGEVSDEWERHFATLEKAQAAASEHFGADLEWKVDGRFSEWEARPKARYETHYVIYEIEVET